MDVQYIAIVIGVILFSMTLHEVMHGLIAYHLGDDTAKLQGRLTLNPLKHIDPFLTILLPVFLAMINAPIFGGAKPVPFNPHAVRGGEWGAALVAVAGPLVNIVLAFIFFGVYVLAGLPSNETLLGLLLPTAVIVNIGFFIFNMLPIPPLDGSRVVYALAPEPVRRAMEFIEQYGLIFIFALVLLGYQYIGQVMIGGINFFFELFVAIFNVSG